MESLGAVFGKCHAKTCKSITVIDESDRHFSTFAKCENRYKRKGKPGFSKCKKSVAKYLIKLMENEALSRPKSKKGSKIIKKALGFSL